MKQYKVLKEMINAPVGTILNDACSMNYLVANDNLILANEDIEDAIEQCFIEEYIPEPKRWRAKQGCIFYFIILDSVLNMTDDYCQLETRYYNSNNYFRSELTAQKVLEAKKLFFKYLHIAPGTPQQNIKNDFEHAHAEARKAVLKDNNG